MAVAYLTKKELASAGALQAPPDRQNMQKHVVVQLKRKHYVSGSLRVDFSSARAAVVLGGGKGESKRFARILCERLGQRGVSAKCMNRKKALQMAIRDGDCEITTKVLQGEELGPAEIVGALLRAYRHEQAEDLVVFYGDFPASKKDAAVLDSGLNQGGGDNVVAAFLLSPSGTVADDSAAAFYQAASCLHAINSNEPLEARVDAALEILPKFEED